MGQLAKASGLIPPTTPGDKEAYDSAWDSGRKLAGEALKVLKASGAFDTYDYVKDRSAGGAVTGSNVLVQITRPHVESGAFPLLEDSPATGTHKGGVHLILLFDNLVNIAAAFATAEKVAPELVGLRERWPKGGGRVRLPFAYYNHKGDKGPCNLWKPGGVKMQGEAAEELLLCSQAPADWVTESPPPPPVWPARVTTPSALAFFTTGTPITEGRRNDELTRVAGAMRSRHLEEAQMVVLLSEVNVNRCVPPLPDCDVARIARSAARYSPG